ncbi:MAG: class II aldolase/adducin family protein [Ruminococcus sp.]|nr:class II aldolase/adducin family protein [Ruminococcus sp.]MBQ8966408.1 class II aldolase/adducin family protein [Ruminococcus sp.]
MDMYEDIKDKMVEVCHKMWQKGWVAANDGNVTVKVGENRFLATRTGISKAEITRDHIGLIDSDFNIIEKPTEDWKPSSEVKMHIKCYHDRPDVGAVVHAHPPVSTGFACAHVPLDDYCMIETVIAVGSVPLTPYGTPSTFEVPEAIEPYLQEHDVMLLTNHGALTVGADLTTAYYRMETLELQAQISLVARLLGGVKDIDRDNIDRLIGMRPQYGVTGKHPGYKKYSGEDK